MPEAKCANERYIKRLKHHINFASLATYWTITKTPIGSRKMKPFVSPAPLAVIALMLELKCKPPTHVHLRASHNWFITNWQLTKAYKS